MNKKIYQDTKKLFENIFFIINFFFKNIILIINILQNSVFYKFENCINYINIEVEKT